MVSIKILNQLARGTSNKLFLNKQRDAICQLNVLRDRNKLTEISCTSGTHLHMIDLQDICAFVYILTSVTKQSK